MRDDSGHDKRDLAEPARRTRKPYTKPVMREYGSIAKLTQSGGTSSPEPGGGMQQFVMMCL